MSLTTRNIIVVAALLPAAEVLISQETEQLACVLEERIPPLMGKRSGSVIMTNALSGHKVWRGIINIIDARAAEAKTAETTGQETLRFGVLIAGGDTVLARWEHDMVNRHGYDRPLGGVASVLSSADAALCNLECCVSRSGSPVDKGERCSFYYRARPEMLRCLTGAGIDIVTAANNHGGDYGPAGVSGTVKWCRKAGLVCVGNGAGPAEAEEPRIVRIGSVRVAVAGMDTTTPCFSATEHRAGLNYAGTGKGLSLFTEKMERLARRADGRCDLLVLTIHWGRNWERTPRPVHRTMARIAFEKGVDLILGHSAHRLQGIEVINGKAVVYDMGNLLFDCTLKPAGRRCALFRFHLSPSGVKNIQIIPIQVLNGYTVFSEGGESKETLSEMKELCASMGTAVRILDHSGDVKGPVGVIEIQDPRATPRSAPENDGSCTVLPVCGEPVTPAVPAAALTDKIPQNARVLVPPEEVGPNVQLLAHRIPETAEEGGILFLSTWWRVTGPVDKNLLLAFNFRCEGETPRRGTPWYTRHDPGDWSAPLSLLKPGQIVKDRYPARLAGLPPGPYRIDAMVIDTTCSEGDRITGASALPGTVTILPGTPPENKK